MTDRDEEVKATLRRATDRLIRYTLIYRKQNGGGHRLTPKQRRRLAKKDRLLTTAPILRRPVSHG